MDESALLVYTRCSTIWKKEHGVWACKVLVTTAIGESGMVLGVKRLIRHGVDVETDMR